MVVYNVKTQMSKEKEIVIEYNYNYKLSDKDNVNELVYKLFIDGYLENKVEQNYKTEKYERIMNGSANFDLTFIEQLKNFEMVAHPAGTPILMNVWNVFKLLNGYRANFNGGSN